MNNTLRAEPPYWYVGMNMPTLQIMLCGVGIRDAEVTTDYPGVMIDSLVRLDSPDYLLVYLDIRDAMPGDMPLRIYYKEGLKDTVLHYPLRERDMPGTERRGFTNADVLYMLMPDRFAQGHTDNSHITTRHPYAINRREPSLRHGGDLEGIRRHLDYFCDLGVTALWLTPVLENDSPDYDGHSTYHGYATTDYYHVDPRFGTNEEYCRLVSEAHAKGLKVVMDMIFNHCGLEHPWIDNMPSKDWFNAPEWLDAPKHKSAEMTDGHTTTYAGGVNDLYIQTNYRLTTVVDPYASDIDLRETVDGWFVPSMPDLNQRNPHVMRYLIQNSIWWIETAGIDGIRMDTYPYADAKGMALWMKTIHEEYPHFNVVGESWVTEPAFTAALQRDSRITPPFRVPGLGADHSDPHPNTYLTSVMDFAFFDRINAAKHEETDAWGDGLNRIYNTFVYDYLYPAPHSVMAFLDNHDTNRFLGDGKDIKALKQALALLLTINRIPQLYYGTEILMGGTTYVSDGNVRQDFPGGFPGDKRSAFTPAGRTRAENALYDWLKRLLHWRQGNKVITEGRQIQFIPWKGVYVMAHIKDDRTVLLILNGTSHPATFESARYREVIPSPAVMAEVTSGRRYHTDRDIKLSPRQTLLLESI